MSPGVEHERLRALEYAARRREVQIMMALVLPLALAAVVAGWRWGGPGAALAAALAGLAALAAGLLPRLRAHDLAWVTRRLDARHPELEDSTGLLAGTATGLSRLQRLQRLRIARRIEAIAADELQREWPVRTIAVTSLLALVLVATALVWPTGTGQESHAGPPATTRAQASQAQTRITQARLGITPPAYTGLPERSEHGLDAAVAEGSRVDWSLHLEPEPSSVSLQFLDGESLSLQRGGTHWTGAMRIGQSQLYRVVVEGAPAADPRMHRIEAVADLPPRVLVLEPEQNVVYAQADQSTWTLAFEARDDHGLGRAELVLTLAQGSGELVDFSEMRQPLDGVDLGAPGEPPRRRYTTTLEPGEFGFGAGDDLVARLEVRDNREPDAQLARSAAVVLRWPPPGMGDVPGFDGLMQRTMPAYFRSQRQIIIDAEALIAERATLERREFVDRSGDIGADQQLLRLRYGQFMGEEAEAGTGGDDHDHDHDHAHGGHEAEVQGAAPAPAPAPARAPRVSNPLFADDAAHDGHDEHHAHEHDEPQHAQPGAGAGTPAAGFGGDARGVIEQFGHLHDIPEAATLLDPLTRETLRGALRAMWASEGALRLGEPEAALPHAHEALELIQRVRQANRVHLARVGLELPPIDETRRLSGDLEGVEDRPDPIEAALDDTRELAGLWSALQAPDPTGPGPDFEGTIEWVMAHREALEDPLGLVEAIDAVAREPDCEACLSRLRARLWAALEVPAAGVRQRPPPTAPGEHYLRQLGTEALR